MNKNVIIALLVLVLVGILGVAAFSFLNRKTTPSSPAPSAQTAEKATISGHIDLNGTVPDGSIIAVAYREFGSREGFKTFTNSLATTDKVTWAFTDATTNKSYEIQAYVMKDGKVIETSDPIGVTAPATDEVLSLNSGAADPSITTGDAVISGSLDLNGYLPSGATVTVEGKKSGAKDFIKLVSNLPAKDGQVVTYSNAIKGQDYDIKASLFDASNKLIGESKTIVITAPANNETLSINSKASAPAPVKPQGASASPSPTSGVISGKINLNGAAPQNSSLVILASETGKNNFNVVVNGISVSDNANWSWNGASSGVTYDLVAVLKKQNDNGTQSDVAKSQTMTVAAPAANQVLSLNTGFQLSGPTGTPQISCGVKDSSNNWTASLQFPSVSGAQSYWLQLGTSNGGSDITNSVQNGTNDANQTVNITIKDSVIYYARYAYATSTNASSNQFSPFSAVTSLKCPR